MNIPPKYEDLVFKIAEMERRETALLESLTDKREEYNKLGDRYDALQHRLNVAEQRASELEQLLQMFIDNSDDKDVVELSEHALHPAAEGEGK